MLAGFRKRDRTTELERADAYEPATGAIYNQSGKSKDR